MRVLLAEDDLGLQYIYSRVLRDAGCEVVATADGAEAYQLLQNEVFGVALLDVLLPNMNGIQLLEYANSAEHLAKTELILMSANRAYEAQIRQYPRARFLAKPFQLKQLRDMVSVLV